MRYLVPCYGPSKGQLVAVPHTLEERPAAAPPSLPCALPRGSGEWDLIRHQRGSVSLMEGQLLEAGMSHELARETAITAARRHDGEHGGHVPYIRPEEG